jgi:L-fuconolactonase
VIDSHVHLWSPALAFHQWPGADLPAIHRAYGLADLSDLDPAIDGVILVQAQPDPRETDWLLDLATRDPRIVGVVGWLPLDADDAAAQVARYAARPGLVGLRPMLQAIADPRWILGDAVQPALAAMTLHGLSFDALIQPRHLSVLHELAERHPALRIVVDHGAKPAIGGSGDADWRAGIAALGRLPNLWCKLSGLWTEQAPGADRDAVRMYVEHLLHSFPGRVMWGGDWPVLLLSGARHGDWLAFARTIVAATTPAQTPSVFEGAARDAYRLPSSAPPAR